MFKKLHQSQAFSFGHKIKIWKPKHYEAIPHYVQPQSRDPFEYKLRTKAQIEEEHKKQPPLIDCKVVFTFYNFAHGAFEDRDRKVKMYVDMKSMNLTKMQKARLVALLGPRYSKDNDKMVLTCEMYMDPEQNEGKLQEMVKELYLEAKRAP